MTIETGTARGDAAFDFYDYDQSLQSLGAQRLADFQAAASGLSSDVSPWLYWPWILAGATLLLIGLAVRPRLAEYRYLARMRHGPGVISRHRGLTWRNAEDVGRSSRRDRAGTAMYLTRPKELR